MNQINKTSQINQMDQTDQACLRRAGHRRSGLRNGVTARDFSSEYEKSAAGQGAIGRHGSKAERRM